MTLKDIKINHGSLQSDWTLVGGGGVVMMSLGLCHC